MGGCWVIVRRIKASNVHRPFPLFVSRRQAFYFSWARERALRANFRRKLLSHHRYYLSQHILENLYVFSGSETPNSSGACIIDLCLGVCSRADNVHVEPNPCGADGRHALIFAPPPPPCRLPRAVVGAIKSSRLSGCEDEARAPLSWSFPKASPAALPLSAALPRSLAATLSRFCPCSKYT